MERGQAHSHVLGLGVDKGMNILEGYGLFGMENARKGASIFADMVLNKKTAGKALLITGDTGTGKTALALALSRELGIRVPFTKLTGSEVYSSEIRKTEILIQAARRSTTLRIREIKRVYEGEVIDLKMEEKEDPLNNYRKSISTIHITLRSTKGSQRLSLLPSLSYDITKQKITVGDIVYIEADEGIIKKIGRSDTYASEFDIESEKYIPVPKGEVFTKKEIVQEMSLHEIDLANSKPKGEDTLSLLTQIARSGKVEIPQRIREEVNMKVEKYLSMGVGEITPGVLFIDESHTLDEECFSFLSTLIESPLCPIIVLATNRRGKEEGKEKALSFGMPREFLNRLFIIRIEKQKEEEVEKIVKEKIRKENIKIEEEGISYLCEISKRNSIRYAFNLLPLSHMYTRGEVTKKILEEVSLLFS